MTEIKVVMGNKSGKSFQKLHDSSNLIGRKIGENIKGDIIGVAGYEFLITGGSDSAGFPMRKDIKIKRARILARKGVGIKTNRKGQYIRKTVAGNTIEEKTAQVNLKVIKEGSKKLEDIFGTTNKGAKTNEKAAEAKS